MLVRVKTIKFSWQYYTKLIQSNTSARAPRVSGADWFTSKQWVRKVCGCSYLECLVKNHLYYYFTNTFVYFSNDDVQFD